MCESKRNICRLSCPSQREDLIFFLQTLYPNMSREELRQKVYRPAWRRIWVLKDLQDQILGSVWVIDFDFRGIRVGGIAGVNIQKDLQGCGFGKKLMQEVLQTETDFSVFLLWTRVEDFFKKLGFERFNGIETQKGDSTPMIYFRDKSIRISPVPFWTRIRF